MSHASNPSEFGPDGNPGGVDPDGERTLEVMSVAPDFNRWMFETIRPYCTGSVLEVGSGIGNISAFLLDAGYEACLTDLRPHYCEKLRRVFGQTPNCRGVAQLDLAHPEFDRAYHHLLGQFGTVFALNVVEHIADDRAAVANCRKLLRPDGRLIILVPAYPFLYNRLDRQLGHYRRYTRSTLTKVFRANDLDVVRSFHFNLAGVPGWFASGTILRNRVLPTSQVALYNRMVSLFRLADRLTLGWMGLSVVAVGQVRAAAGVRAAA